MASTTKTLRMKLLIDTKANRVVFAEADKDVVDFLFSLLALPVARNVRMLGRWSMLGIGSVGNLYASVEDLDSTYVLPGAEKKAILRPTVAPSAASTSRSSLLLPAPSSGGQPKSLLLRCSSAYAGCEEYVTDTSGTRCPICGHKMTAPLKFVPSATTTVGSGKAVHTTKGFVQGVVTYTVRDNLTVTPMSTISSIAMFNTFAVTDFTALQEKTVLLGYVEGLAILRASLHSTTVLTDVFLGSKRPRGPA